MAGGSGNDTVNGGGGNDLITGGPGDDTITCGDGTDTVTADAGDTVADDCEETISPRRKPARQSSDIGPAPRLFMNSERRRAACRIDLSIARSRLRPELPVNRPAGNTVL